MRVRCETRPFRDAILLALALTGLSWCRSAVQTAVPEAPAVVVATPLVARITEWDEYTGRFEATDRVEVRARVDGYLDSIHFRDGAVVKAGQLLFVIDPRPYEAALEGARADVVRPGANAETVAATVASPLEQEINGVEDTLYLSSQSTSDGRVTITVTFPLGTDLDEAQVLVQNRVNIALPRLPEEVRRLGIVTNKNTPDILLVVQIYSPDDSRDQLYLSNYSTNAYLDDKPAVAVPVFQRPGSNALETAERVQALMADLRPEFPANIIVIRPPSVRGVSTTGGFKFIVQDRSSRGLPALRDAAAAVTTAAAQEPSLRAVFSQFEVSTPQLYVDIDRARAQALGVPPSRVFEAIEVFLGSSFVNDFNYLGRTYRVTAQADSQFRGQDNNLLTQIGLVVLVGLACKNAILIVEFAKQAEDQLGLDRVEAAVHAARLRLRPILMTSFAFILGVAPLLVAEGAGAEARQALGTAVFAGMIGVTFFGLLFTPAFYVVCRRLALLGRQPQDRTTPHDADARSLTAMRSSGGEHHP